MKTFPMRDEIGVFVERSLRSNERPERAHKHDFIELVYTKSGSGTHYINERPYRVQRGDLLFINYGETHAIEPDERLEFYNFLVKPEFIAENVVNSETIDDIFLLFLPEGAAELQDRKTSCVRFKGADLAEIEMIVERMAAESKKKGPCYRFMMNGYMRLIFAKLIRGLLQSAGTERPALLTKEVLSFLDQNFTEPVTASALAERCFYNPAYLGRVFKTVYGKSMKEYIREKRMEYAVKLLKDPSLTIDDIYQRVGYTNKTQFYKCFRSFYGVSPGEYKKGT